MRLIFQKQNIYKKIVVILLTLTALALFSGQLLVVEDDAQSSDAIIVIGGDHKPERVKHAVDLYQQGYAPKVIISAGTIVLEGHEQLAEAQVMHRQALAMGLPEKDILIEDESKSTYENAYYSKVICRQYNMQSILLVTSLFHSRRAKQIFEDVLEPDIAVRVQPVPSNLCPICWLFDPGQIYVMFYEYQNWIRYWSDQSNVRAR